MPEGASSGSRRLPFVFQTSGGLGRLVLDNLVVGPFVVDHLELEVSDLGTDPGVAPPPERFQRRRTHLKSVAVRVVAGAIEERLAQVRKQLAALGIAQLSARLNDGFVSVRARAADGLAAADISFRIQLVHAGTHLRALASVIRVHGHLPSPGPVIADRILATLLGATESAGVIERPRSRGLCDVEIDLIDGLLWYLMPPNGWRLPAVTDIELVAIRIHRSSLEIAYGPPGMRSGDLGVRPQAHQLAAAHDLMHSVDAQLRDGHLEDAMRGYRALLAAGGPDQPLLLERILSLASARPAWFFDGLELARQALGRWPNFPPAHAALASITLAQGDAREAASHLTQLAQLASAEGDDDQAALAALAGARLLRVLAPTNATQLYELALEHDPGSSEAADSLADRLADEQRWPELVRLVRARAVSTTDPERAVALRLRLADVFVHQLGDPASAQQELTAARELAPEDPAVHEMTATVLGTIDPPKAIEAWREVARLAEARGDHQTCARAWAILGDLQATAGDAGPAEAAWRRALELDPLQADALAGLADHAVTRGDHAAAAELFERMRGLGLPQHAAARHELMLAKSYLALDRSDDARSSLRRATVAGGETAAEAHAVLAQIAEASYDRDHAAAELDTAISSLVDLASDDLSGGDRLYTRAAELAVVRAHLFDRSGQFALASEDYQRAHALAHDHAPALARDAAKTMLSRAGDDAAAERRWIDALLATRPPPAERASLLVRRAEVRRRERTPDLAAALADLHEALKLLSELETADAEAAATRRAAYQLEADLLASSGNRRARAQALSALAKLAERDADRVEVETAAAAAWLAADEPAAALPHGARALVSIDESRAGGTEVPAALHHDVLRTLGEAAWRQRAWPDVIRAYRDLIAEPGPDAGKAGSDDPAVFASFRYRLAVAADRTSDPELAIDTLRPLVTDTEIARATPLDLRGQALRLYADLAERAGDLGGAAAALEGFSGLDETRDDRHAKDDHHATARADAMYRAGELFRRAGREDDAIRCLETALKISDTHLPALDALEAAWRERGDLERVSVILGRKVAATARHPARQKPLLSRLGDLQDQLGRPDVALATHQRALEIDPAWRPSLRYVTVRLRDGGELEAAARGLAQLAGELPNDQGVDLAIVAGERQIAAIALAELVVAADDEHFEAIREDARAALERTAADAPKRETTTGETPITGSSLATLDAALARLRGNAASAAPTRTEEDTQSGRVSNATGGALSLRDAAARARAAGKLDEAFAALEAANHVNPGDLGLLRELVDLAQQLGDREAAARHLTALAGGLEGTRRGDALLELAGIYYDQLDDLARARRAMRDAITAFGSGNRHDIASRMLATEAATNLAWDIAIAALEGIPDDHRAAADLRSLVLALSRAGRDADAVTVLENAGDRLSDDELLSHLRTQRDRKAALDRGDDIPTPSRTVTPSAPPLAPRRSPSTPPEVFERPTHITTPPPQPRGRRTPTTPPPFEPLRAPAAASQPLPSVDDPAPESPEAREPAPVEPSPPLGTEAEDREHHTPTLEGMVAQKPLARIQLVSQSGERRVVQPTPAPPADDEPDERDDTRIEEVPLAAPKPSVVIAGTASETANVVAAAAASANRDRLLSARRAHPEDASLLLALLAHLGNREPRLRHDVLEETSRDGTGRALAIALHELALLAREAGAMTRASSLWARAFEADPTYEPLWMHVADVRVAENDLASARALYEKVAASEDYEPARRAFAADRAEALGREDSTVAGEVTPPWQAALQRALRLADSEDWQPAIDEAERAVTLAQEADKPATSALLLLERLYLEVGDVSAASEAIGRQLVDVEDAGQRAILWRRRARLYRDTLGRDAEAYRCLKEAHACAPADPEIAYQLRTAAMVRGEWALAASLLYREIAAAANPRDRGALHLELALIYDERLDDETQAQVNFEQALAFDPTIPAAKLPLARRYEATGRHPDAARLYREAAESVRPAERAALIEAAERAEAMPATDPDHDLAAQLRRHQVAGDDDAALAVAHQLWRAEPGHPKAYAVLIAAHRAAHDLAAMTDITAVRASQTESPDERATMWLEVARLAEEHQALDQAARAYDLALIEDPGHVGALDARGALAFRLGDFATADSDLPRPRRGRERARQGRAVAPALRDLRAPRP